MDNFKEVEEFFAENGFDNPFSTADASTAEGVMLRLDLELADDMGCNQSQIANILMMFAHADLIDLAINGDTSNEAHPLLKVIDGANKRGKELESIEITQAQVFPEPKPRKGTTEYTTYLRVRFSFK